ncbi:MAG TPA: sulfite oxidase-like oxidoreductase [Blastocatellia bacterium]|nr:sulfite oxidase-like oxidoreductase [Blastocatellia bacterium]
MNMIKNIFGKKDDTSPDTSALEQAEASGDIIVSPDVRRSNRIPPGQSRTVKWPVLHAGGVPAVNPATWDFRVDGLVNQPLKFSFDEFIELPRVRVLSDFHCVTRWSRLNNLWEGVSTRLIAERAGVKPEAKFVLVLAEEGWTTNMPLEDFLAEDALFAYNHDNAPLEADHGGPLRLVVPRLYAWKSAKWVRGVEFRETDQPGFWEEGGYHMHGDPWTEERFYWS